MDLLESIRRAVSAHLPGPASHEPMMGYRRASPGEARNLQPPAKESAVIMLLYYKDDDLHTVFIRRPDGVRVHSNQLSFPGGRLEAGETPLEAALRETHEEIGIAGSQLEIIGTMTELYIPPSHFIVQPYLAFMVSANDFVPNPGEVVEVIEYPVRAFLRENIIAEKEIYIPVYDRNIRAKYFDVNGHTLWGATAMMVQEFRVMMGFST